MEFEQHAKFSELSPEEQRVLEHAQKVAGSIISSTEMNIYTNKKHCLDSTMAYRTVGAEEANMIEVMQVAMGMAQSYFAQNYPTELISTDQETVGQTTERAFELIIDIR